MLYHVKYRGGSGDPLADFDMKKPHAVEEFFLLRKQEPGELAYDCSWTRICVDFEELRQNRDDHTITISNLQTSPDQPHEFLVFINDQYDEDNEE